MTNTQVRSSFVVHGTRTGRLPKPILPSTISLSPQEIDTLYSLTRMEKSAMDFWKAAFAARGISCPRDRICAMVYQQSGQFRLEWHPIALGPKAIAAGKDYRAFAERKDREFAQRRSSS